MEQVLYEQVIILRRNYLEFVVIDRNKNEAKFKFQGQSARSQRWFDLDFDWIEKILAHVGLVSIRNSFKSMTINKIQIHLKAFKFL